MAEDPIKHVRLWDLRTSSCRWPLGEPREQAEFFCGEPAIPGGPYCREHRERAFTRWSPVGANKPMALKDRS